MTIQGSRRAVLAIVLASALTACAPTGAGTTPFPDVTPTTVGTYAGSVVIDGQTFGATMTLRASESLGVEAAFRVQGMLRIPPPMEIEGEVDGIAVGDILRLGVEYRSLDGCDGRIDGILDVTQEGAALDGPVTVEDCGDPVAGELTLRRREMTPG